MKAGTRGEAKLYIEASPEKLYHLISDVRRMPEWSPECRACDWLDDATGPSVGARFKGTNRRRLVRWSTTVEVLAAREGREFTFATFLKGHKETKWTYLFTVHGSGTTVTESFELLTDLPWHLTLIERWIMGIKDRKADLEAGMRETLQRLKSVAEDDSAPVPSARTRSQTEA